MNQLQQIKIACEVSRLTSVITYDDHFYKVRSLIDVMFFSFLYKFIISQYSTREYRHETWYRQRVADGVKVQHIVHPILHHKQCSDCLINLKVAFKISYF